MQEYHWYDLIGNVGVFMILIAYCMLQLNRINNHDLIFSLMNLGGAFLILVSLYFDFNLSAFFIEFFWFLISLYGIFRWSRTSSHKSGMSNTKKTVSN
jgi:hypothetical protein